MTYLSEPVNWVELALRWPLATTDRWVFDGWFGIKTRLEIVLDENQEHVHHVVRNVGGLFLTVMEEMVMIKESEEALGGASLSESVLDELSQMPGSFESRGGFSRKGFFLGFGVADFLLRWSSGGFIQRAVEEVFSHEVCAHGSSHL